MTAVLVDQMEGRTCWHLTLTRRHKPPPLRPLVKQLFQDFTRLRQSAAWAKNVNGGARFLDVSFNYLRREWGPHLHIVIEAHDVPLEGIRRRWFSITGGSEQIYLRPVLDTHKNRMNTACYVTAPPFETFSGDEELMSEYAQEIWKVNPARSFGEWHSLKLLPRGSRKPPK